MATAHSVTYSFIDCFAAITGPGLSINLGMGAGVAEEGITIEYLEDKSAVVIGADGTPMQTLHAGTPGTILCRLLKTSPTNSLLSLAYNFQKLTSGNWGQNTIVLRLANFGDIITASACAFKRGPTMVYAKAAGMNEWAFSAGQIESMLGGGVLTT